MCVRGKGRGAVGGHAILLCGPHRSEPEASVVRAGAPHGTWAFRSKFRCSVSSEQGAGPARLRREVVSSKKSEPPPNGNGTLK